MRPRSTLAASDCKVTLKCQFLFLPGTSAQTAANVSRYRDVTARFRIWEKPSTPFRSLLTAAMEGLRSSSRGGGLARPAKWEGLERKVGQG